MMFHALLVHWLWLICPSHVASGEGHGGHLHDVEDAEDP